MHMTKTIKEIEQKIDEKEFKKDVAIYQQAEEDSRKNFLNSVIQLGEILSRMREKYTSKESWKLFLDGVGKSYESAKHYINLFEYSKNNLQKLLDANIDRWNKVNEFLYLPEETKNKLAKDIKGKDISSKEFKDKVGKLKVEDDVTNEEDQVEDDELDSENVVEEDDDLKKVANDTSVVNFEEVVGKSGLVDTHFMAKQVLKEMASSSKIAFSKHCLIFVEVVLEIEKLNQKMEEDSFNKVLSQQEKDYWLTQLRAQLDKLSSTIDSFK